MELANSTQEVAGYRIVATGGGQPLGGRRALKAVPTEPLSSGILEANTYVKLKPSSIPCVIQFLRGGRVIAQLRVDHSSVLVALIQDSRGVYKPMVMRESKSVPHKETMYSPAREGIPSPLPEPQRVADLQARRIEKACSDLLEEFGALTSAQIGDSAGLRAAKQESIADRWRQEGKIFSVAYQGATLYPAFQFDAERHPRPAVARVIQLLGDSTSEWGLALWFAAANGWLDGRRPVDLLASAPEEVVEAAEREAEELVF